MREIDFLVPLPRGATSGTLGSISVSAPSGASLDDVRAGGRVVLLPQDALVPAAALSFSAWIPSGDERAFSGTASARYEPSVIVGATYSRWLWTLSLGRRFQPETPGALIG